MVAHEILVSAQGPLVLVLGLKGLGLRVWGQGLTKTNGQCIRYQFCILRLGSTVLSKPQNIGEI